MLLILYILGLDTTSTEVSVIESIFKLDESKMESKTATMRKDMMKDLE